MATRSKSSRKSVSRTQKRYVSKTQTQNNAPHAISTVGGGQSGMLGSSSASAGAWG